MCGQHVCAGPSLANLENGQRMRDQVVGTWQKRFGTLFRRSRALLVQNYEPTLISALYICLYSPGCRGPKQDVWLRDGAGISDNSLKLTPSAAR